VGEWRVIRACARAAMLTNRNGTHEIFCRVRVPADVAIDKKDSSSTYLDLLARCCGSGVLRYYDLTDSGFDCRRRIVSSLGR
jgi:hypothetical protein